MSVYTGATKRWSDVKAEGATTVIDNGQTVDMNDFDWLWRMELEDRKEDRTQEAFSGYENGGLIGDYCETWGPGR